MGRMTKKEREVLKDINHDSKLDVDGFEDYEPNSDDLDKDFKKINNQVVQDEFIDEVFTDLDNEIKTSSNDYDVDDLDLSVLDSNLSDEEIDKILDEE